jgi:hypothetical protein
VSVPGDIPGLGSTAQKIRPNPTFDAMSSGIGPEEYFVLSRVDGALTLREVILMTGLAIDRAIEIVVKLRGLGALLLPGETSVSVGKRSTRTSIPATQADATKSGPTRSPTQALAQQAQQAPPAVARTRSRSEVARSRTKTPDHAPPVELDTTLPDLSPEERTALQEQCEIADDERRRILAMTRRLESANPWALFGLTRNADKRTLKRSYFKLSKDFHPDRFYGKRTGTFGPRLERIFEALARAYQMLAEGKSRDSQQPVKAEAQTPAEYAAELFERACQTEIHGDPLEAMKLFAAAIRIDSQLRYLRRACTCALSAGQPRSAEEYAKKASALEPMDPSIARLLASAFRAQDKLDAAEEVLVMALAIPSDNDVLVTELRRELAEIRRQMNGG